MWFVFDLLKEYILYGFFKVNLKVDKLWTNFLSFFSKPKWVAKESELLWIQNTV